MKQTGTVATMKYQGRPYLISSLFENYRRSLYLQTCEEQRHCLFCCWWMATDPVTDQPRRDKRDLALMHQPASQSVTASFLLIVVDPLAPSQPKQNSHSSHPAFNCWNELLAFSTVHPSPFIDSNNNHPTPHPGRQGRQTTETTHNTTSKEDDSAIPVHDVRLESQHLNLLSTALHCSSLRSTNHSTTERQ